MTSVPMAWAQSTTPHPDQLEPGVDTSATPPPGEPAAPVLPVASPEQPRGAAPRTTAPTVKSAPAGTGASKGSNASPSPDISNPSHVVSHSRAKGSAAVAPGSKPGSGKAQDRIDLDTTQITGNRELPKVLYIVPWKRSDLGDLLGRPPNSLLDEVLAPVDRDVFKRQNRYYDALKPDAAQEGGGATDSGAKQ